MKKNQKDTPVTEKTEKPLKDLQSFIESVNKKDKLNGKKVHFGFTKRKR